MFILDSHCDTPSVLQEGLNLGERNDQTHVDFIRAREAGVDGMFFAIYTPPQMSADDATVHALKLISLTYDAVDRCKDRAALAVTVDDALRNQAAGRVSVFLGMENGLPIQENMANLHLFHRFGIRYLTLCHNAHNQLCDSAAPAVSQWGGLSPFGREVVRECNRLGILLDCSHASDNTFNDLLQVSDTPIVASHSSCRALCPHKRNMSDEMIRDLAAAGGVIQINFYPKFIDPEFGDAEYSALSDEYEKYQELYRADLYNVEYRERYFELRRRLNEYPAPGIQRVVEHIDHAVEIAGAEHVGLGSDFDGIDIAPEGLRDISAYPAIITALRSRGYTESAIEGIMGGNFLRILRLAEETSIVY